MKIRFTGLEILLSIIVLFLLVCGWQLKHQVDELEAQVSTILDQQVQMAENQQWLSEQVVQDGWESATFKASAYSPLDDRNGLNSWGDGSVMASGALTAENICTAVSVDPEVIPLGTKVWIDGIGWRVAMDTGGAIQGYKLDIPMWTFNEAMDFGVQEVKVIYPKAN